MTTPAKAEREELRACPFCGHAPRRGIKPPVRDMIFCDTCHWLYEDNWNRRSDPVRDGLVEALESIVAGDIGPDGVCHGTFSGSQCVEIARAALASAAERKAGRG